MGDGLPPMRLPSQISDVNITARSAASSVTVTFQRARRGGGKDRRRAIRALA